MGRRIFDIDAPDRFVAATQADGEVCYLEAARDRRRISVSLEPDQLTRLAHGVLAMVGELEGRGLTAIEVRPADPSPRHPPRRHAFRAEVLTVDWDDDGHRIIVEARSPDPAGGAGESAPPPGRRPEDDIEDLPDDAPLGPDVLRVRLSPHMAYRFARQAAGVMGARPGDLGGRPGAPGGHGPRA